jgi:hypothetical protein
MTEGENKISQYLWKLISFKLIKFIVKKKEACHPNIGACLKIVRV